MKKEDISYWPIIRAIPDELFLRIHYRISCGRSLNLKDPKGFNEKLQWLKLHDRNPEYTNLVDKIEVKRIVGEKIGYEHIIPTLNVWDSYEDIDFERLPDRFVIKCSHDSGSVIVCRDKRKFDENKAKQFISDSLKRNYYYLTREWPYKNVKPRILAEECLSEDGITGDMEGASTVELGLTDYKFYCFNGIPRFLYVSKGLEDHSTALMAFLYLDWTFTEFQRSDFARFDKPQKPHHFEKMIECSKHLSKGIPFVRVDFYEVADQFYFSELTFFPSGGFALFEPNEWETVIGEWISL